MITVRVDFALPTREMIAENSVVDGAEAQRCRSYDEAKESATQGRIVRLYMNSYPPEVLERRHQNVNVKFQIARRPVPSLLIEKQEGRAPDWYFDGAWVFGQESGPTTLVRADSREEWRNVTPGFFASVDPARRYERLHLAEVKRYTIGELPAFEKALPDATVVKSPYRRYVQLGGKLTWRQLLEYSKRFEGTEYALSGPVSRAPCIRCYLGKGEADRETVAKMIAGLGLRDTRKLASPEHWLGQRRDKIVPQLVAGLDNPQARIARGCLSMLKECDNPIVVDALVRIAGDRRHAISTGTTKALCRFGDDPRAKAILAAAADDAARFPDREVRAKMAAAGGDKAKAVALLVEELDARSRPGWHSRCGLIRQLGELRHSSAVQPLTRLSRDRDQRVAVAAYLALEKIDPREFGLTEDQRTFIQRSGRGGKVSSEHLEKMWDELAKLNRDEIRPYVMQFLKTDSPGASLRVLRKWGEAPSDLTTGPPPQPARTARGRRRPMGHEAVVAERGSVNEIIGEIVNADSPFDRERIMRNVGRSEMPTERKLAIMGGVRNALGPQSTSLIAKALRESKAGTGAMLLKLMRKEPTLKGLAGYAWIAPQYRVEGMDRELARAMRKLAGEAQVSERRAHDAVVVVLNACAAFGLTDCGSRARKYMDGPGEALCLAAAHACAKFGNDRPRALRLLYAGLDADKSYYRKVAAEYLLDLPCQGEAERARRERIILAHVGRPSEDHALRLLITCAGAKSQAKLLELLDDEDVKRAVYAAWVLAQVGDEAARKQATRRLAIYALFWYRVGQISDGIGFRVTEDIDMWMAPYSGKHHGPVGIDPELLDPFEINRQELAFAIRSYRSVLLSDEGPNCHQLATGPRVWPVSYLPLLRVIAREDPKLEILYVLGQKVAHFPNRKLAAQAIAVTTGEKASYTGLAGEPIDSEAFPMTPYPDQTRRMAAHVVSSLAKLIPRLRDDEWYTRTPGQYAEMISRLVQHCGKGFEGELVRESERQGIAATLKRAKFSLWAR